MFNVFKHSVIILFASVILNQLTVYPHEISAPTTAAQMAAAADIFLNALKPEQRQAAQFAFEDAERFNWHYFPRSRSGLAIKDMSKSQRKLAFHFLKIGLSQSGYLKATRIIALEAVLREIETWNWLGRDPEKYFFSFFGQPSEAETWGWRVEGHHLSLNITIVQGRLFATAPRFLGANPARVEAGELQGIRTLKNEEDLARSLIESLDQTQQSKAVFRDRAYRDIVSGSDENVSPFELVGISAAELNRPQRELLVRLIEEYASAMPPEIARQRMDAFHRLDSDQVYFGWAGGLMPGQPHYYRIQTPTFIIEYDNVQNGANHIHTVWRDFERDFGRDLLRDHYRKAHP